MNIKVVIVWAFVVVLFAGLGIFGYVNQDLLLLDNTEEYTPIQNENYVIKRCNTSLVNGNNSYIFSIKDDKIEKVSMNYTTIIEDNDAFASATNINLLATQEKVAGINTIFTGNASNFMLNVEVKLDEYDSTRISTYAEDFAKLSMVISQITDYEAYKELLLQTGNNFTCE